MSTYLSNQRELLGREDEAAVRGGTHIINSSVLQLASQEDPHIDFSRSSTVGETSETLDGPSNEEEYGENSNDDDQPIATAKRQREERYMHRSILDSIEKARDAGNELIAASYYRRDTFWHRAPDALFAMAKGKDRVLAEDACALDIYWWHVISAHQVAGLPFATGKDHLICRERDVAQAASTWLAS